MNEVLDLDALNPKPIQVRIGGEIVEFAPPGIGQVLDAIKKWQALQKQAGDEAIHLLIDLVAGLVGEDKLALLKTLTFEQLMALANHLSARLGLTEKKAGKPRRQPRT